MTKENQSERFKKIKEALDNFQKEMIEVLNENDYLYLSSLYIELYKLFEECQEDNS